MYDYALCSHCVIAYIKDYLMFMVINIYIYSMNFLTHFMIWSALFDEEASDWSPYFIIFSKISIIWENYKNFCLGYTLLNAIYWSGTLSDESNIK